MTSARCQSFRAGHNLHPIQISKTSAGDYGPSKDVELVEVGLDGVLVLRDGEATIRVWHHHPSDVMEAFRRADGHAELRGSMLRLGGRWFSVDTQPDSPPMPVCGGSGEPDSPRGEVDPGAWVVAAPSTITFEEANLWRYANQVRDPAKLGPVEAVLDLLMGEIDVEAEWHVRRPGALSWIAYQQAIDISATLWAAPGGDLIRLSMRSAVVEGAHAESDRMLDEMSAFGAALGVAPLTATRALDDPEARPTISLTLVSHVPAGPDRAIPSSVSVGWRLVSHVSHRAAPQLAESVSGSPVVASHPSRGRREEPSHWLKVGRYLVGDQRPAGPSERTLEALADARALPWLAGKVVDGRFRGFFSLMTHKTDVAQSSFRRRDQVAVVDVDLAEHPLLGASARILMSLSHGEIWDSAQIALDLNTAESDEFVGFDVFGTWAGDPEDGDKLYHVTYLPSLALEAGLLEHFLHQYSFRVRWAAQRLGLDGGFNDFVEMTGGTD